ncbi:NAD(P)-binding domain-containing protein [Lysobacter capsici]|uniref:NAD(P)-binding domain-containing protein n=1 Tax=Lysobacter capsici TaxID=435897 RepID=UPI00398CAEE4
MSFDTVSVIGLGYIGLPTAAAFAAARKRVIGIDVTASIVDTINRGEIHIIEPELDTAVRAAVSGGFLRASLRPEAADAFLIAVPTPFKNDHEPDLSYIEAAAKSLAPVLRKGDLVVLESTSPVGATEQLAAWLAAARPDLSFPQAPASRPTSTSPTAPSACCPGM